MGILGNRVQRIEDQRLVTGHGGYVDNVAPTGAAHVTFVPSIMAHAKLVSVNVSEARKVPGVIAIFTAEDVGVPDMPSLLPPGVVPGYPGANTNMMRPALARGTVRFVGEPVAVIVAENRYAAADARELVVIDYEPLPCVVDPMAALNDEVILDAAAATNLVCEIDNRKTSDPLDGAHVVIEQRLVNHRIAAAPLEVRTAAAAFEDGRLTFYGSTQGPSGLRGALSAFLGLAPEQVRVVAADVGGGFGAKGMMSSEELIVASLAMRLGRPMKWTESRWDNMLGMAHGRAQIQVVRLGATADGKVVGVDLDVVQDCGAYPSIAPLLPTFTWLMMTGPYDIGTVSYRSRAVLTNTTPVGAFRGAGRPEATFALERGLDLLALELGLDPTEIRRRNLLTADRFPYTTPTGALYDSGDYLGALDKALEAASYHELRAEQQRRRQSGDRYQLGIGVSCYVEITNPIRSPEPAYLHMGVDGRATVFTGTGPHGQGHETSWAMIAADRLGIDIDRVTVIYGDTDRIPPAAGTGGSRSAQTAGAVVSAAAYNVINAAMAHAADALEAPVEDVRFDKETGSFSVVGTPARSVNWLEVMASAGSPIEEQAVFEADPSYPFGAHVAVVEVDSETGNVVVRQLVACDDCGTILNPLLVEGQIHGGAAQGIAQALFEEIVFDEDGNPRTASFAEYLFPSAADLPSYTVVEHETPSPNNELGVKGVGESGTIGSTPAVVSAVHDALAPYGVRHLDMPLTPMKVWESIQASTNGR